MPSVAPKLPLEPSRLAQAVTVLDFILEVVGLNLGRVTECFKVFIVFVSPSVVYNDVTEP
jgi:hypothetical protein